MPDITGSEVQGLRERILILDAQNEFRDSLSSALRDKGFSVVTTSTGSDALRTVQREIPNLLILDLLIPDMAGEDVCRVIKTDQDLPQLPIMVLTSKNDLETKLKCLEIGVEEYLVKPIQTEEIVARISRFFRLMNQWRVPHQATAESGGESNSNFSADVVYRTLPTINLPAAEVSSRPKPDAMRSAASMQAKKLSYGVYRLESVAGTGGMSIVYKAHDESLDRYVAIKVLSKVWSSSPEFVDRFRKEAKLIAAINHPGIAQIYTFAEEQGVAYFALQWCSGGSLSRLIHKQGKIELLPAIDIMLQCARALEAASRKGVVHRDIKPSNLMFDENQQVKIVDFGIASSEKMPEKEDPSSVMGSPAYMSPEQGRGANTDHRSDIYSLGITFYQMLYGCLPFSAASAMEYVEKHARTPFPSYDPLKGKIPPGAYEIIVKMSQKNPAMRYQKYSELIKSLERLRNELYCLRRLKIPALSKMNPAPVFKENNFFDLMARVFRYQQSGLLKVSWGSLQKRFLILRNEIVLFESPQQDENFWRAMVCGKLMKMEDVPSSEESMEESLNRLLYLQAFTPEDFKAVYRETMVQSVMQVFLWPVFEGEFFEGRIENAPLARIPLSKILMDAARSMIPKENISRLVQDRPIVRTAKFEERLKILNLSRAENFLASRVEGENITLQTLQLLTGFPAEQVLRTVYALERVGVLKYVSATEQRPRTDKPAPTISMQISPFPDPRASVRNFAEIGANDRKHNAASKWLDAPPQADSRLASTNYEQAELKYKSGQYPQVIRLCTQAIKNNPAEAKYHYLLALALTHFVHSMKGAMESFREAIQLDPTNIEYRLQFADFLKKRGGFDEAFQECRKALEILPHDRKASTLLMEIELQRNRGYVSTRA